MLGTRISTIAYPMLVLTLTKSPVVAGWAAFAATAPSILVYIPAGALIDRLDARRVMLCSELGRGCAVATVVYVLYVADAGDWRVGLLIVMALIEETLEVFSTLSEGRLVTGLLGREKASSVAGGNEARTHIVILAGRPIGGVLFGFSHVFPFLADAASFVCSIGSICSIRKDEISAAAKRISKSDKASTRDVLEGWRWVWRNYHARFASLLNACTTLVAQALIMILLVEAERRKLSYFTVGVVLAFSGVGGALGAILASRLRRLREGQWLNVQMWIWAFVFLGIVFTINHALRYLLVEMFLIGLTGAISNVNIDGYFTRESPEGTLARVSSVNRLLDFLAAAIGPLLGGLLVAMVGPHRAIVGLLAIVVVLAVASSWMPKRTDPRGSGSKASMILDSGRDAVQAPSTVAAGQD
jgi:MFS family permease